MPQKPARMASQHDRNYPEHVVSTYTEAWHQPRTHPSLFCRFHPILPQEVLIQGDSPKEMHGKPQLAVNTATNSNNPNRTPPIYTPTLSKPTLTSRGKATAASPPSSSASGFPFFLNQAFG